MAFTISKNGYHSSFAFVEVFIFSALISSQMMLFSFALNISMPLRILFQPVLLLTRLNLHSQFINFDTLSSCREKIDLRIFLLYLKTYEIGLTVSRYLWNGSLRTMTNDSSFIIGYCRTTTNVLSLFSLLNFITFICCPKLTKN